MSFEQSLSDGGLVVNARGGYNGGYSGGAVPTLQSVGTMFTGVPGVSAITHMVGNTGPTITIVIGVLLILLYMFLFTYLVYVGTAAACKKSGFSQFPGAGHPGAIQFAGSNSQIGLGVSGFAQEDRAREYAKQVSSGFMNSRETPYFPDVTNRVLRMENREKEAVRALGKINQERNRRAADDSSSTTALAWGPFWKEWKATHPMDGDITEVSGFEDTFERALNQTSVY
jgi:hypothetical protein